MKIILAPDSFKGSLTSLEVAEAMEAGIKRALPDAECIRIPMADGGEGTVQSLLDAIGGELIPCSVTGPAGQKVAAAYGMLADGRTAVIEMAAGVRSGAGRRPEQKPAEHHVLRHGGVDP